ncbi:MAG: hypothetical protein NT007_12340 [Candidatus Kapabacteria bacterium]|nr:hypothetical protein [Candidatus Kapabacteria bacterium]
MLQSPNAPMEGDSYIRRNDRNKEFLHDLIRRNDRNKEFLYSLIRGNDMRNILSYI